MAPRVQASDDADEIRVSDEEDSVGKTTKEGAARLTADERIALRHADDLGENDVDGAQELRAKAGGTLLAPAGSLGDVGLGRRADEKAHASAGLVQALLDAGAHHRPALAGLGVASERGEATVQLG